MKSCCNAQGSQNAMNSWYGWFARYIDSTGWSQIHKLSLVVIEIVYPRISVVPTDEQPADSLQTRLLEHLV